MIYNLVGCGGTFDRLHAGHKAFLRFAFSHGKHVLIGLTTDLYLAHNKPFQQIAGFSERKKNLEEFLTQEGYTDRFVVVPIDTLSGPTLDPKNNIEALVVTEETTNGAKKINEHRNALQLPPLQIIMMPLVIKNDQKISSSLIREGKMDREGNVVIQDYSQELLLLPEKKRKELQIPFGILYKNENFPIHTIDMSKSIIVGDATTVMFHKYGKYPALSIVDFTVQRKKQYGSFLEEGFQGTEKHISILNPSGSITPQLWQAIRECIAEFSSNLPSVIFVEGEEDLAVLPLVVELPLGFHIYYGQPNEGIVDVEVTMQTKVRVKSLLWQFNRA